MLAPDWTWFTAVPIVLAVVALLWIPGTALAAGLGAGRWPAIALAPLMTTGLVSVGGILTALVGIRWGLGAVLFWLIAVPVLVCGIRLLLSRSGRRVWRFDAPTVRWWEVAVGLAIAVVVAGYVFRAGTVRPGNIPQQSDQIYHLGLVRWMLDAGNLSSLTADGFNYPEALRFYPAAFHDVAATVVLLTGAPIVVVESSLLLVSCGLVFPLGMMLMLNTLVAADRGLVWLTGLLALSFTGSPWKVMVWGAVWAQVYGSVFIPAVVAVYGWGLRQVFAGRHWGSAALLFGVGLSGITLAHTSATFGAATGGLLLSVALSLHHALRGPGAGRVRDPGVGPARNRHQVRRWLPFAGFVALAVLAPLAATRLAPPGLAQQGETHRSVAETVIGVVTFWGERATPTRLASAGLFAFAVIGGAVCVRRGRDWWLAATGLVFLVLGSVLDATGTGLVWPWTWPWYNWAFRVQGVTDIYALALVVIGAGVVLAGGRRLGETADGRARPLTVVTTGLVLAALLAVVAVQSRAAARLISPLYKLSGAAAWITTDKARALVTLSGRMPPDAVVATNPWRGGQFLYLLGPQRTVIPTEKSYGSDISLISGGLKNMTTDPAVCGAVERQRVTYVITGGAMTAGNEQWYAKYAAIDEVDEQGGFRVVARADPYTLWKVPDCRT
ncbi:DUF6541 family protein [Raineyella sp. W15-4]|uniref:DUF6541 family protein n=1 Tax=Raineyella sp. W15-4 TaxID=3081651 RepID=UPI0029550B11|nr:DUF6541 family protein [Raineyella sp. W15-4]WOQ16445.1 DUF6541 family protein [Raineyella sp. W15-4]